ncbi:MAG: hotdog fold thioesterase [Crocinitomicaceae bacterium]|nr:hotdog fold thioesterase [Crocinitomicaceae bacterium]
MKTIDVNIPLEEINKISKDTMLEKLGIEFTELGPNYLKAKMPVDERTFQPMKLLHGGANAALMETLGSFGSHLLIDQRTEAAVGLEINANHLGSARSGWVEGIAKIIHQGRSTHVWQIDIFNEEGKLISTGRLTNLIKKMI